MSEYEGTAVADWVAEHADRLVAELSEACTIPSVSASRPDDVERMAQWLENRLAGVLDEVRLEPVDGAGPLVVGRAAGRSAGTVLLYSHYDVQPADGWDSDPFTPVVTDGRIRARGVADDKADIMARIHALEALRALGEDLPCSVAWLSEGAEEVGSVGLSETVTRLSAELRADGCLWESYLRDPDGRPEIGFGARGTVYVELSLDLLGKDQHSAFAGVYRSAPVELAHAIATMVDVEGRVLVDGLMDATHALSQLERDAAATIPAPDGSAAALPGIRSLVRRPPAELGARMVIEPTINVAGLGAGYQGDGAMTIVPASAWAKLDVRIIGGQSEDLVVDRLRAHLDRYGFDEVQVRVVHSVPASSGPLDTPFATAIIDASRACFGEPVLYPLVPGSGPLHIVADTLGVDIVAPPGSTRMDSNIHGQHESIAIKDYLAQVSYLGTLLRTLGTRWELTDE